MPVVFSLAVSFPLIQIGDRISAVFWVVLTEGAGCDSGQAPAAGSCLLGSDDAAGHEGTGGSPAAGGRTAVRV